MKGFFTNPLRLIAYIPRKLFKLTNFFNEYRWAINDSKNIDKNHKVLFVDLGANLGQSYKWFKKFFNHENVNFELFYKNSTKLNCWTYWHCFMPQIRHIVNEHNKNVCFFIGRQENLEKDLNELLVGFGLKSVHIPYLKNKTKHDGFINQFNQDVKYHSKFLYKLFDEDYKRLILNEEE